MLDIASNFRKDLTQIFSATLHAFLKGPTYLPTFDNVLGRAFPPPLTYTPPDLAEWRVPTVDDDDDEVAEVAQMWPFMDVKKLKKRTREQPEPEGKPVKKIKLIPLIDLEEEDLTVRDKPSNEELVRMRNMLKPIEEVTIDDDDDDRVTEATEQMETMHITDKGKSCFISNWNKIL